MVYAWCKEKVPKIETNNNGESNIIALLNKDYGIGEVSLKD